MKKIFLVGIYVMDCTDKYSYPLNSSFNVYSTFEKARENGLEELNYLIEEIESAYNINFFELVEKEELSYEFSITQIDDFYVN